MLPVLPPDETLALLRRRSKLIEESATTLAAQIEEAGRQGLPTIFLIETEYRLALIKAERQFVIELIGRMEKGWGPLELWRGLHRDREATLAKLYREFGGGPMS